MNESFGKKEKLKSKKLIGQLFSEGKSLSAFPIRLVFLPIEENIPENNLVAVSAPKKNFKKAVDRNYIKRLLRENYRKNKFLMDKLPQKYALLFIYTGKKTPTYQETFSAMEKLLKKFIEKIEIDSGSGPE